MDRPLLWHSVEDMQRVALTTIERRHSAEELDRAAQALREAPQLQALLERIILVVTTDPD